jgi:hypothetical protein
MNTTGQSANGPPRRLRAELLPALGAAALASAIGIWALQLWKANLRVPLVIGGDSTFPLLVTKDIITHGWDLTNPNLGAPFGQELYDYPATSGDSLYLAIIRVLGIPFGNPAVVLNIFFLLGFPLIAAVAYGVLRKLNISVGVAVVCATLYAVLPFHFGSSETHVFLSSYFVVPVCCYLILAMFDGRELFARDCRRSGLHAYLTLRSAAVVALCVVLGSSDNYFALFTVALMAPAAILSFLATRRPRPLVYALVAVSIILGTVALNGLPTIVYVAEHGRDTVPGHRLAQETEAWGLSLATLVLPIEGDRIPPLAHLAQRYSSTTLIPRSGPTSEPSWTNLGFVGTLGLLWLMVALAIRCVVGESTRTTDLRAPRAALAAGMAFLIGTVGGLGTLFAYVINPQLHAPGRICVFIAFFALFGAALGLDGLRRRLDAHRRGRMAFTAMLAVVLLVGVLSQTSPTMVPEYTAAAARYESDGAFVRAIEAQLPGDASIFQLPYVPFPEGADPGHVGEYEDLFDSLHSNRLRWSGGAMEGRPTDWVPAFVKKPLPQILEGVAAIGFSGLYVDREGVAKGASLLSVLSRKLGVAPLTSGHGRFAFFNMTAYDRSFHEQYSAAQIAGIAQAALYPRS